MTVHHNTDHSNAYCHCPIGRDHGNLPIAFRENTLRRILAGFAFDLVSDKGYTLIRPGALRHTPAIRRVLIAAGFTVDFHGNHVPGVGIRLHSNQFRHLEARGRA